MQTVDIWDTGLWARPTIISIFHEKNLIRSISILMIQIINHGLGVSETFSTKKIMLYAMFYNTLSFNINISKIFLFLSGLWLCIVVGHDFSACVAEPGQCVPDQENDNFHVDTRNDTWLPATWHLWHSNDISNDCFTMSGGCSSYS